ncbi:membrane-associated protein, putative, partial [Bodo saltans]
MLLRSTKKNYHVQLAQQQHHTRHSASFCSKAISRRPWSVLAIVALLALVVTAVITILSMTHEHSAVSGDQSAIPAATTTPLQQRLSEFKSDVSNVSHRIVKPPPTRRPSLPPQPPPPVVTTTTWRISLGSQGEGPWLGPAEFTPSAIVAFSGDDWRQQQSASYRIRRVDGIPTFPQARRRKGEESQDDDGIITDAKRLEQAASEQISVSLQSLSSSTFVSRQKPLRGGRAEAPPLLSRWMLYLPKHRNVGGCITTVIVVTVSAMLMGVSSTFSPDADALCVTTDSSRAGALILQEFTRDGVDFCAVFYFAMLMGVSSTFSPDADALCVTTDSSRAGALILQEFTGDGVGFCAVFYFTKHTCSTSAATPTTKPTGASSPVAVRLAVVTTVKPLGLVNSVKEKTLQTMLLQVWSDVIGALVVATSATSSSSGHLIAVDDARLVICVDSHATSSSSGHLIAVDDARLVICVDSQEDADEISSVVATHHRSARGGRRDEREEVVQRHPSNNTPTGSQVLRRGAVVVTPQCEAHPVLKRPTYRGLFQVGEDALESMKERLSASSSSAISEEFVMMVNADVVIGVAGLQSMLSAAVQAHATNGRGDGVTAAVGNVLVSGSRWNCNPNNDAALRGLLSAAVSPTSSTSTTTSSLNRQHCQLFQDDAEDYFLLNRGALPWRRSVGASDISWAASKFATVQKEFIDGAADVEGAVVASVGDHHHHLRRGVPPLVVGGVAFDNWLVAAVATSVRGGVVLDATPVVDA